MNIAICDDMENELEDIVGAVTEYAEAHPELFIKISRFSSPLDMLDDMNRNGVPDIALLDICMPGILGTEIANEIRTASGDNTDIIFLTTSSDFAVEAFALHANDYITKPYTKERLAETLDRAAERREKHLLVPITSGREVHRVDLYRVLYAEARNHGGDTSQIGHDAGYPHGAHGHKKAFFKGRRFYRGRGIVHSKSKVRAEHFAK